MEFLVGDDFLDDHIRGSTRFDVWFYYMVIDAETEIQ